MIIEVSNLKIGEKYGVIKDRDTYLIPVVCIAIVYSRKTMGVFRDLYGNNTFKTDEYIFDFDSVYMPERKDNEYMGPKEIYYLPDGRLIVVQPYQSVKEIKAKKK